MNKLISTFIFSLTVFVLTTIAVTPTSAYAQKSIFDISSVSLFDNKFDDKNLSNDDEFLKVDQAFSFNFDQQNNKLNINFIIAPGYYLYRHQFKFSQENSSLSPVDLPQGIDHEDEFFGIQQIYTGELNFTIDITQASENSRVTIRYQGCAEKGLCYPPTSKTIDIGILPSVENNNSQAILSALNISNETVDTSSKPFSASATNANAQSSEQHQLADMLKQDSLLLTLIAFFVGGLLLSFTPCVFPMYPILTGIIVGQGKDLSTKKAFTLSFFYVQGMAVTYTILGIVVALAGAQFQAIFQHPSVLVALSILFIFLALSMFGVFNLALPASWQNKLNNISNKQKGGSIAGVVMMGVISGLVASPCTTAPLTGALLYISQTGDVLLGASALYALSLGMGLPLLILGSSGGKLLPKAGAWMNIIKNIFGLLLLAVPIFLLERFIPAIASQALWALLVLAAAGYFYVANKNHASSQPVGTAKGLGYGLRSVLIFLMLFFGANSLYQLIMSTAQISTNNTEQHSASFTKVATLSELQSAVTQANKQGKTVMVDLYADWCVACKEFEQYTFIDENVQQVLKNTVWLQVDLTDTGTDKNIELMENFNVFGLPSILFFDINGKELSQQRVTGFMAADEFTLHVKAIF
ncbi:MAG: protein-disulfide reductase DsbD [Colwellia sp.]